MLVERAEAAPDGCVRLHGHVRGANLSADALLHIPDLGDAQLLRIESPAGAVLHAASPDREPLQPEAVPAADTAPEQAFPGQPCMPERRLPLTLAAVKPRFTTKRVPVGTSEYQAAWILEDEEDELSGEEEEEEEREVELDAFGNLPAEMEPADVDHREQEDEDDLEDVPPTDAGALDTEAARLKAQQAADDVVWPRGAGAGPNLGRSCGPTRWRRQRRCPRASGFRSIGR